MASLLGILDSFVEFERQRISPVGGTSSHAARGEASSSVAVRRRRPPHTYDEATETVAHADGWPRPRSGKGNTSNSTPAIQSQRDLSEEIAAAAASGPAASGR